MTVTGADAPEAPPGSAPSRGAWRPRPAAGRHARRTEPTFASAFRDFVASRRGKEQQRAGIRVREDASPPKGPRTPAWRRPRPPPAAVTAACAGSPPWEPRRKRPSAGAGTGHAAAASTPPASGEERAHRPQGDAVLQAECAAARAQVTELQGQVQQLQRRAEAAERSHAALRRRLGCGGHRSVRREGARPPAAQALEQQLLRERAEAAAAELLDQLQAARAAHSGLLRRIAARAAAPPPTRGRRAARPAPPADELGGGGGGGGSSAPRPRPESPAPPEQRGAGERSTGWSHCTAEGSAAHSPPASPEGSPRPQPPPGSGRRPRRRRGGGKRATKGGGGQPLEFGAQLLQCEAEERLRAALAEQDALLEVLRAERSAAGRLQQSPQHDQLEQLRTLVQRQQQQLDQLLVAVQGQGQERHALQQGGQQLQEAVGMLAGLVATPAGRQVGHTATQQQQQPASLAVPLATAGTPVAGRYAATPADAGSRRSSSEGSCSPSPHRPQDGGNGQKAEAPPPAQLHPVALAESPVCRAPLTDGSSPSWRETQQAEKSLAELARQQCAARRSSGTRSPAAPAVPLDNFFSEGPAGVSAAAAPRQLLQQQQHDPPRRYSHPTPLLDVPPVPAYMLSPLPALDSPAAGSACVRPSPAAHWSQGGASTARYQPQATTPAQLGADLAPVAPLPGSQPCGDSADASPRLCAGSEDGDEMQEQAGQLPQRAEHGQHAYTAGGPPSPQTGGPGAPAPQEPEAVFAPPPAAAVQPRYCAPPPSSGPPCATVPAAPCGASDSGEDTLPHRVREAAAAARGPPVSAPPDPSSSPTLPLRSRRRSDST
eukprot:TRINITY_DN2383_c2_g1_i1.p1 TRINITY_DN2383_c2_g1~~TRINITY_DN2383_c2_g1_i1.p1  ORF type:complete len:829 (+),score=157.06 TRINITY_DN2383_c2_g1_i1:82-2568(+)